MATYIDMRRYETTDDSQRSTLTPDLIRSGQAGIDRRVASRTSDLIRQCRRRLSAAELGEVDAHARWIDRRANDPLPYYHLAEMCRWYGHLDLWRDAVDLALSLAHDSPEQIVERAHAKLLLGDWSGWRDRELRFFIPSPPAFPHRLRSIRERWDGVEDISDKSLLVVSDGGFGDCIQMLRYVPWITHAARTVTFAVQPELVALVNYNFRGASSSSITESYDRYASVISLPAMAGTLPEFEPLQAPAPYRFAPEGGLRVGLCWAGSPLTHMELRQPLSLDVFAPLLACTDIQWYSLQIGSRAREIAGYPEVIAPPIPLTTFAETANLIAGLDAVVTVDTSVAHLAGSMGVPTWLLLHVVADPRWGLADTTPWYPSMRLIRQRTPGDSSSVIDALTAQVREMRFGARGERLERRAQ